MSSENSGSQWNAPGMRPTLNGTGFMFEVLDEFANGFIEYSRTIEAPVLDIGCAFGVASRPALEGGARVVACDMEQRHLDILRAEINPEHLDRLECVQGSLPSVDFEPGRFGAILCSRVLHFLDGSAIDASIRKMASWLQPGGRLYLLADTPYGFWRRFIPVFEAKTARGDRWPGLLLSPENYLPFKQKGQSMNMPPFMNLLVPELMARSCSEAGLTVEKAEFVDRSDFGDIGRLDGRENAGVLATRPG